MITSEISPEALYNFSDRIADAVDAHFTGGGPAFTDDAVLEPGGGVGIVSSELKRHMSFGELHQREIREFAATRVNGPSERHGVRASIQVVRLQRVPQNLRTLLRYRLTAEHQVAVQTDESSENADHTYNAELGLWVSTDHKTGGAVLRRDDKRTDVLHARRWLGIDLKDDETTAGPAVDARSYVLNEDELEEFGSRFLEMVQDGSQRALGVLAVDNLAASHRDALESNQVGAEQ